MSLLISTFSAILFLCPAQKNMSFTKDETTVKPSSTTSKTVIIYKKVPTKWIKITKNSI